MSAPKKPQDHKSKKQKQAATPDEPFTFTHLGEEHTIAAPSDVLTAGWARTHRHLPLENQFWDMIEALADEDALAAIDDMKRDEFQQFQRAFYAHAGVELGE